MPQYDHFNPECHTFSISSVSNIEPDTDASQSYASLLHSGALSDQKYMTSRDLPSPLVYGVVLGVGERGAPTPRLSFLSCSSCRVRGVRRARRVRHVVFVVFDVCDVFVV